MIIPQEIKNSEILKNQRSVGDFLKQLTEEYNELIPYLPESCDTIWDIGCGLAGIDVFLSKHYNSPHLYLTDYNKVDEKLFFGFNEGGYCAYNSFNLTRDLLDSNGIDNYHFDIINEIRNPPIYADIIISTLSCGFHYPVSMYREEIIKRSLKGTVLILDMREGQDQRYVISDYFDTVAMLPHRKWSRYIGVKKMRKRKIRIDARCSKDPVPKKGPQAEPRRWTGIIERIPKKEKCIGAEIGVLKGQTAREILQARPLVYHILVDPWSDDKDESYINSGSSDSKQNQDFYDKCFKITSIRMQPFKGRVEFMRMKSVDASHLIEDNSLDYVFIDGDHSYEGVARDIETWISKIKPGGWIGGHDYNDRHYPGVSKAVHENFDNIEIGPDHTWFVRIK